MELKIKGKKTDVPDALELYTERKLSKLTKFNRRLQSVNVVFTEEATKKRRKSHRVEVVMHAPGQILKAEEENDNFYIAVDEVADKLKRQLKKLKTKRIDKTREAMLAGKKKVARAKQPPTPQKPELSILVEHYSAKPISTAEALEQLSQNGRSFYMFVNSDSSVNCVFKHEDGSVGILLPEDKA